MNIAIRKDKQGKEFVEFDGVKETSTKTVELRLEIAAISFLERITEALERLTPPPTAPTPEVAELPPVDDGDA